MAKKKERDPVTACAVTGFVVGPGERIEKGWVGDVDADQFDKFEKLGRLRVATDDDIKAAKKKSAAK